MCRKSDTCLLLSIHIVCSICPVYFSEATVKLRSDLSSASHRTQRSARIISEAAKSGLRAVKQLLNTAHLYQKRKGFDVYDKQGGNQQALLDFYAIQPKEVKNLPWGSGKSGVVGDRKIQYIRGRTDRTLSLITIRQGESLFPEHIIICENKIPRKSL